MRSCTVLMFPGQGAQFLGMGIDLLAKYESHTNLADRVLGYSVRDVCQGKHGDLNSTEFTQPALFLINILNYLERVESGDGNFDVAAGHSLGEYCALYAAGAFSFETAIEIVRERGKAMASCKEGSMAAVIGLDLNLLEEQIQRESYSSLSLANCNSPQQHVIAGDVSEIEQFESIVLSCGGTYHKLNVSGAFHSPRMKSAATAFRKMLSTKQIYPLKRRVLSNVSASYFPDHDKGSLVDLLVRQLSSPVLWRQSLETLSENDEIRCIECGPRSVVARLAHQTLGSKAIAS